MNAIAIDSPMRRLRGDSRGAIMVLGIFFACIMIGWMWMLVGLGDAMIWRDRSQEAADAITYSSAAIQAKGMNLISFLNAIMLVITFAYLIMAVLYNMLDVAHVIFGSTDDGGCISPSSASVRKEDCDAVAVLTSEIGIGEALEMFCGQWKTVAKLIKSGHDAVGKVLGPFEKKVMAPVLPVLSKLEDVAAYGAPWAGEAVGVYMGTKYVDWGQSRWGIPLSATLVPGKLTPFAIKWNTETCETADDAEGGQCHQIQGLKDGREGLPVEIPDPDGMSKLCSIAGKALMSGLQGMVEDIPILGTIVGYFIDGVADAMEDSYCKKDSTGLLGGLVDDMTWGIQILTFVQLGGGMDNNEKCPNDNWGANGGGGGSGEFGCGGPGTCEPYQIKTGGGDPLWEDPDKVGGPHLVVEYASNGNDWFQVWSFVYGGNRNGIEQAEKKVGVAGMDSQGPTGGQTGTWQSLVPQDSEDIVGAGFPMYVAQSEFYFDCTEKWKDDDCNADYNKASFEMRWRARLRRVRGLSWKQDLFGYFTGSTLGDQFNDFATKWLNGAGSEGEVQGLASQFGNFISKSLIKGAFGDIKDLAVDKVGGLIDPANVIPDVIH